MIIKPTSAIITELDGMTSTEYGAMLAADYPCVKHLWQCNQSEIGLGYLTDIVQGVLLNKSSGTVAAPAAPDGFSVYPNHTAATTAITGTLQAPNGSPFMFFQVAIATTGGIALGDTVATNGPGIGLARTAANAIVTNTPAVYPGTAWTTADTTIMGRALFVSNYNSASGMQTFSANATSTNTAHAATTTADSTPTTPEALSANPLASLDGSTNKWACGTGVQNLYMAGLFIFTTAPTATQVQSWLAWMTYYASIGKKYVPPSMKGIA